MLEKFESQIMRPMILRVLVSDDGRLSANRETKTDNELKGLRECFDVFYVATKQGAPDNVTRS